MIPMLVESAIKNICGCEESFNSNEVDWLDLTWLDCRKRFAQKRTRAGHEVRLLLRLRQSLKHGDVLGHWPDGKPVIVNLLPAQVLLIRCENPIDLASVAFQIGNLHLPIELSADHLLVPTGGEVEAMLIKFNIPCEPQLCRFEPTHLPDLVQLSDNFRVIRVKV